MCLSVIEEHHRGGLGQLGAVDIWKEEKKRKDRNHGTQRNSEHVPNTRHYNYFRHKEAIFVTSNTRSTHTSTNMWQCVYCVLMVYVASRSSICVSFRVLRVFFGVILTLKVGIQRRSISECSSVSCRHKSRQFIPGVYRAYTKEWCGCSNVHY